ncbi:hypothetical protein [uncultured archaeal virus]|uniref:Uncharacterized protein n=1 Tax=uncultured archaeal virus TaxID=1960247 RepID=A0A8B0LTS7_9VIRU|nr:hypothetical protein [uncultured archaeal virus]
MNINNIKENFVNEVKNNLLDNNPDEHKIKYMLQNKKFYLDTNDLFDFPEIQKIKENDKIIEIFKNLKDKKITISEAIQLHCNTVLKNCNCSNKNDKSNALYCILDAYRLYGFNEKIKQKIEGNELYNNKINLNILKNNSELIQGLSDTELNVLEDYFLILQEIYNTNKENIENIKKINEKIY